MSGVIDNSMFGVPKIDLSIGKNNSYDFGTLATAGKYASDAILGTNFIGNDTNKSIAEQNLQFQKDYAAKMEALQRESWQREDNAVQRRVEDLKAAGLSPTLAAGSAAATSAPIQLKAPQNEFQYQNPFGGNILTSLAQVMSLKNADLQNQLLKKQVDTYGEPAWFKAFEAVVNKLVDKDWTGTFMSNIFNGVQNAADALGAGPIKFKPEYGFTFAKPPLPTKAANTAIARSAVAHGAKFDESSMTVQFMNSRDARDWYLSIGGTSYEWYYGLTNYKSVSNFLSHIIRDGYITRDGDVYLDR